MPEQGLGDNLRPATPRPPRRIGPPGLANVCRTREPRPRPTSAGAILRLIAWSMSGRCRAIWPVGELGTRKVPWTFDEFCHNILPSQRLGREVVTSQ